MISRYLFLFCLSIFAGVFTSAENAVDAEPFRLMSKEDNDRYRRMLPKTGDPWLFELFTNDLVFFTDKQMPRAFQYNSGVYAPGFNLSANKNEPYGNPNVEFPWGSPAGTHRSTNAHAVRFVHLSGPVIWWKQKFTLNDQNRETRGYGWEYHPGTVFGELLMLSDPEGRLFTYEVRTRAKGEDRWYMDVFRPFTNRAELVEWLAANAQNVKLNAPRPEIVRLMSVQPKLTAFDRTAAVDELPEMPRNVVIKALGQPYQSVMGKEWMRQGNTPCYAPTTKAPFGIVPTDYDAGFVRLDNRSCMSCHDDVLKHAEDFDRTRDWRGRVRGSDKIFSFHIFDPACISPNGIGKEPKLRQQMIDAGLLRHWKDTSKW